MSSVDFKFPFKVVKKHVGENHSSNSCCSGSRNSSRISERKIGVMNAKKAFMALFIFGGKHE